MGGRNAFCQASSKGGKVSCSRTVSFNFAYVSMPQDLFKGCLETHTAVQLIRPYLDLLWKGNALLFLKCLGKHREIQVLKLPYKYANVMENGKEVCTLLLELACLIYFENEQ